MNFFHRKEEVVFFTSLSSQSFANLFDRLFLVIVFLILLTFQSFAQSDNWTLSAEKEGVKIYHQKSDCDGEPVVLLKFVNDNSDSVKVEWDEYVKFSELSEEIKLLPEVFSIDLPSGQIEATGCAELKTLQLVSRPNSFYSYFHMDNSDTTQVPTIPQMEIETYRVSGVKIIKQ